jgi:multidrug efflux pump subunit AcrB
MLRGMLIGLLGVFILLSFQFRSYLEPLVVMAAIPCAFIGVIWGHLLIGVDFCMPSALGFVSLAGVVVNDSILLVLFIKQHVHAGEGVLAAAARASRLRFRAVLLTSLTTIAGLLPLMLERSLQAQVLIPLAVSIVFGILASTLLVLLLIPCLYGVLGDLGLTERGDEVAPEPDAAAAVPGGADAE